MSENLRKKKSQVEVLIFWSTSKLSYNLISLPKTKNNTSNKKDENKLAKNTVWRNAPFEYWYVQLVIFVDVLTFCIFCSYFFLLSRWWNSFRIDGRSNLFRKEDWQGDTFGETIYKKSLSERRLARRTLRETINWQGGHFRRDSIILVRSFSQCCCCFLIIAAGHLTF